MPPFQTVAIGSIGSDVKLVQSVLKRIGYNPGSVDGVFGAQTQRAVIEFQRANGLVPDGIVGPATFAALEKFLLGYFKYAIRPGDTLYRIAKRYNSTVNSILTANPGVDPRSLRVAQIITIPYNMDVVFTDVDYTYEIMERDIMGLKARYPFITTGIAGNSVLGRNLYSIQLGNGPAQVHYNGAHHGLEWITAPLLMKFIENFCKAYTSNSRIRGYDIRNIWEGSSIYIVPMVNPDGVSVVLEGIDPSNPYYDRIMQWNNTGRPLSEVWQANIRGVDLNRNYPASWEEAKAQEAELGITGPGPTRYGGPSPLSEPESQAMVSFTMEHDFKIVIAYHTQGKVIYWRYKDITPEIAGTYAEIFARVSGYEVAETPYEAAYAGYKDWFIEEYRRPGYTIEAGIGINPLPISQFNTIYNDNEEIMLLAPVI